MGADDAARHGLHQPSPRPLSHVAAAQWLVRTGGQRRDHTHLHGAAWRRSVAHWRRCRGLPGHRTRGWDDAGAAHRDRLARRRRRVASDPRPGRSLFQARLLSTGARPAGPGVRRQDDAVRLELRLAHAAQHTSTARRDRLEPDAPRSRRTRQAPGVVVGAGARGVRTRAGRASGADDRLPDAPVDER